MTKNTPRRGAEYDADLQRIRESAFQKLLELTERHQRHDCVKGNDTPCWEYFFNALTSKARAQATPEDGILYVAGIAAEALTLIAESDLPSGT